MVWYKRLRLRLIASQFLVVVAGVLTMLIVLRRFIPTRLNDMITQQLGTLDLPAELSELVQTNLVDSINELILLSLGVAAVIALIVGIFSSLLLWFIIITPIRNMADSSQRIASGRYDERVKVPNQAGEAMQTLATNFNQMAQSLESVEEQRVRLMGNVTHELRTPLSSLSGYVEGLGDGVFEPSEKLVGSMQKQIGRMKRLIDDTQELSQAEEGSIRLNLEAVNMSDVINQAIFQLLPSAQAKSHELTFHEPEQDVYVTADYDRLIQILLNLISNGISYTPPNGQIELFIAMEKSRCQIKVKDNGIGIPAKDRPFVFERFYRVDQSRSREQGGSGVGLTISRNLARHMGGELFVAPNQEGPGSCFTLSLPSA